MEGVLNGYVTNPNPTPTLTPNANRNSNPNQINEKIQKETTLEIDQITKCQFGRWKLVKTLSNTRFLSTSYPGSFLLARGNLVPRAMPVRGLGWHWLLCRHVRLINVKPITAQEKFNFPRANAILARAQALLWLRDWARGEKTLVDVGHVIC